MIDYSDGIDNLFDEIGHEYPCENPFDYEASVPAQGTRVINGRVFTVTQVDTVYRPTKKVVGYKRSQKAWSGVTDKTLIRK